MRNNSSFSGGEASTAADLTPSSLIEGIGVVIAVYGGVNADYYGRRFTMVVMVIVSGCELYTLKRA